jgi:tetratricopeptide (TPR) repeat protein
LATIAEIEKRGAELRDRFDRGAISEEDFRTAMVALRFQDASRRWWMLGAQSSKWYMFDGTRWVPGTPPDIQVELPSPLSGPQTAQTKPASQVVDNTAPEKSTAAIEEYTIRTPPPPESVQPPGPPESVATRIQPERRKGFRISPIMVTVGALAFLVLIAGLLITVDNLASGRPISSLFGGASTAQLPSTGSSSGLPANVIVMISAGDQAFAQGQIDTAIAQYQKAAQTAPSSAIPLTRLSRSYAFKGQIQDAINRSRQAVKNASTDSDASGQLCRALTWDGQVDEAIKTCEGAIKIDSKNANAHAFLTEAYLHANRVSDAQAQATLALQLAPQSAEAHRAQAWVLTLGRQKDAAVKEWNQTQVLEPNLFYRYFEAAEVQRIYFNSTAAAVPGYQKTLELNNAYLPAIVRLGLAFVDINQPQSAIPPLRRAATLSPNDAQVIAGLGIAYQKTNQCSQGIPYLEQALKLDPNNSMAQRGMVECKGGQAAGPAPAPPVPTVPIVPPTAVPGGQ